MNLTSCEASSPDPLVYFFHAHTFGDAHSWVLQEGVGLLRRLAGGKRTCAVLLMGGNSFPLLTAGG
eukprot:scaffold162690_cov18-Tisochrysis_lutea.AAC.2